jgi:hypothetical protein
MAIHKTKSTEKQDAVGVQVKQIVMRFQAKKGSRIHRYFDSVVIDVDLWWNCDTRVWEELFSEENGNYSTNAPCKTLRSYRRMLMKNPEIIGHSCLVNRYIGFDVYA